MPLWVKDETGQVGKPWLTVILDDDSRAIMGYRLSWTAPNAVQTVQTAVVPVAWAVIVREAPSWEMCWVSNPGNEKGSIGKRSTLPLIVHKREFFSSNDSTNQGGKISTVHADEPDTGVHHKALTSLIAS